jgi:TRAP-type C4-dicarboxylate transport system substrate-binding protein
MQATTKFRSTALLAGAALALTGCSGGIVAGESADGERTLTVTLYTPEASAVSAAVRHWGDAVMEATEGKIDFAYNYNGGLLAADDTLQGIGDGRADLGLIGALYYENQLPLTSITSVPYLVENPLAGMRALKETYDTSDEMKAEYERNGVRPLFFLPARNALLGATDAPIEGLDDLQGRSTRASGIFSLAVSAAGANPVSINFNELYESLDRGVVDSFTGILLDSVETAGLYEVAPYVSHPRQGILTTYPVSINTEVWESLPDDVRAIMDEAAEQALDAYFTAEAETQASACDVIEEAGGSVTVWEDASVTAWRDAIGDTLIDTWRERVGASAAGFEASYLEALASLQAETELPADGVVECAARF